MADWIAEKFGQLGYLGVALAMLAENVFPPIPSEAILPGAGIAARRGELSVVGVILAAWAGSMAGAVGWFYAGRKIGPERLRRWADKRGRYFGFSPKDLDRADDWFRRWGGTAVLVGRMIPGVRTLVSVPAGIAGMPLPRFLVLTGVGTGVWSALLVLVGWWAGKASSAVFEQIISWVGIAVFAAIALWIGRRIWKHRRSRHPTDPESPAAHRRTLGPT